MPALLSIPFILILLILFIGFIFSVPGHKGEVNDHYDGRKFMNPENVKPAGTREILKWLTNRNTGAWTEKKEIEKTVPPERYNTGDSIRITFINHSTFLIQTRGINILTDPIWGDRPSPVPWIGPRRMCPPGVNMEDLPEIDIILLSHNHYDHLDLPFLKKLNAGCNPLIITPLGIPEFLNKKGIEKATGLDWWQEYNFNDQISIACVPAIHFSGRGMFDRDNTLWSGFVLILPGGNLYFAGDTGYGKFPASIGQKYNPIKVSILPIGAYIPDFIMKPIHTSPEEAIKIHIDCRSQYSIASHFGTFPLGDDGMTQPVEDLEKAIIKYNLPPGAFVSLLEGTWRDF